MAVSWYGRCRQAGVKTETLSVHDAWRAGNITRAEAAAIPPSLRCRDAHVLGHGGTEVAAVEHETGIEILVAGVAVNLASEALIGFLSWSWSKWKQARNAQKGQGVEKAEPSLVLEGVKVRDHTGAPKEIVRVEKRGPLTADKVAHEVREFISSVVQPEDQESVSAASGTISLTFNFHFGR